MGYWKIALEDFSTVYGKFQLHHGRISSLPTNPWIQQRNHLGQISSFIGPNIAIKASFIIDECSYMLFTYFTPDVSTA